MSQALKGVITKEGRVFGDTNTGVDWCVKALHPSDPMTEVRGIPDQSAVPTLCMNYQSTATLTIAPTHTTPWAFDLTLLPHPIYFAYWDGIHAYDPATATTGEGVFQNSQLAPLGTSVPDMVVAWMALAKRWRLCYQSVTVLQDGPDLANQGTLAVCQSTFEPRLLHTGAVYGTAVYAAPPLAYWDQTTEGPNFERSQAMPNAMIGRSRDGAYIPLKLTDTCQDWHSERDFIVPSNRGNVTTGSASGLVEVQATFTPAFPFPTVVPFHGNTTACEGQAIPGLMNGNVAHLSARNLSDQTSFTFQFRMGVEIQLDPSSTLTPQLKLSPPYDPKALDVYFAISRELKDGYPADYNVTGKLWSAIKDALQIVAPAILTAIPGGQALVPMVGPVLEGATVVGRAVRARRKARKQKAARLNQTGWESWSTAPETPEARVAREDAEKRMSVQLSKAMIERAQDNRAPNSARPVPAPQPYAYMPSGMYARALPRRPRMMRRRLSYRPR